MKKKSVTILFSLFLLLGTITYLNGNESPHDMGRYKELAQTVSGFLQSTFSPVYSVNNIKKEDDPANRIILDNGIHEEKIDGKLTAVSWNILRNYNQDRIRESLIKIMEEQNPALILVQEAPVYDESAFWDDDVFSGFNVYYAPLHQVKNQTAFYNFAHTGQLTLSRYSFTKTEAYQLPSVSRPFLGDGHVIKRLALYTQIQTKDGRTVGIYNVHLENTAWQNGRRKQVEYVLEIIGKNNDDVVVIGGDFNTFLGPLEQGPAVLQGAGFEKLPAEFKLTPRLDNFFIKGAKATGAQLHGSGSDHQPIMASLTFS